MRGAVLQLLEAERVELPTLVGSLRAVDAGRELILELLARGGIRHKHVLGLVETALALVDGNLHHRGEVSNGNADDIAALGILVANIRETDLTLNLAGYQTFVVFSLCCRGGE